MTTMIIENPSFELGSVYATAAAIEEFPNQALLGCLARHAHGDWGDLCEEDIRANEDALACGGRLLSSYVLPEGKLWVITEHDRSATTLLLPSDY